MSITIDGSSLVFDGIVTVSNFSNAANGVCTLTLTPKGGVGSLPVMAPGAPGLPPLLTVGTVQPLSPGQAPTVRFNQTSAGGGGQNSAYTVDFGIPVGQTGATGGIEIGSLVPTGSAALNDILTVSSLTAGPGSQPTFQYVGFPFANVYAATTFQNISESGLASPNIATVAVPAQPSSYYPVCFGAVTVVGTANTTFVFEATVGSGGAVVASDQGVPGVGTQRLRLQPSATATVPSGSAESFYFALNETASVSDLWTASGATMSAFVGIVPLSF